MAITDWALFKKHVRADDFADDDEYLAHILDTAEMAVVTATNRPLEGRLEMGDGKLPTPSSRAAMMLGAHWYNQRESVSSVQMHAVPDSLQSLIKPYRKLV